MVTPDTCGSWCVAWDAPPPQRVCPRRCGARARGPFVVLFPVVSVIYVLTPAPREGASLSPGNKKAGGETLVSEECEQRGPPV